MELLPVLRRINIFEDLDDAALRRVAERFVTRSHPEGTLLFSAGQEARGLYVLLEGRVRIFRTNPEGREQIIHMEVPGRAVAELPLFDGGPYPASAMTSEPSRLAFLPRADFEYLYRNSPDVAQAVIRGLGRRLRHLVQVTQTLAFRDVAARLAMLLARYAEQAGTPHGAAELALARTQEEVAMEIGTARESVSRAFKQLKAKGLAELLEGNRVRIPDVDALRESAE
jgi:CRP/FNR family transcriptional regulator, cyclic AMP receptor protein